MKLTWLDLVRWTDSEYALQQYKDFKELGIEHTDVLIDAFIGASIDNHKQGETK